MSQCDTRIVVSEGTLPIFPSVRQMNQPDWRNLTAHRNIRRDMILRLIDWMEKRNKLKLSVNEWVTRISRLVLEIELCLYSEAGSLREYQNVDTFHPRLEFIMKRLHGHSLLRNSHPVRFNSSWKEPRKEIQTRYVKAESFMDSICGQYDIAIEVLTFLPQSERVSLQLVNRSFYQLVPFSITSLQLDIASFESFVRSPVNCKRIGARVRKLVVQPTKSSSRKRKRRKSCFRDIEQEEPQMAVFGFCRAVIEGCFSNLTHLELRSTFFNSSRCNVMQALAIAFRLGHLPNLQHLCLPGNHIGNDGVVHLTSILNSCPNLKTIDLQRNYISQTGISILAKALPSTVENLALGGNILDDSCIDRLLLELSRLKQLRTLGIESNYISGKGLYCLTAAIGKSLVERVCIHQQIFVDSGELNDVMRNLRDDQRVELVY